VASASLAEAAYAKLEQGLVTGELAPGRMLTEPAVSKRLGIGRTPVREALQRLEREGLVRVIPRRGIQVTEVEVASQLEWIEVRRELEKLAVGNAARRADAVTRERVLAMARDVGAVADRGDLAKFMRLDRELHDLVNACAGNSVLSDIMHLHQSRNRRFWYLLGRHAVDFKRSALLHRNILLAIADGDEERARRAADELMDDLRRVTQEVVLRRRR
jgi:DNA-binding GntR family transcriptional regulator